MRIGSHEPSVDLPPAYWEVEKLSREAFALNQKALEELKKSKTRNGAKIEILGVAPVKDLFYDTKIAWTRHQEKLLEVFMDETNAGHFEIFEAEDAFSKLLTEFRIKHYLASLIEIDPLAINIVARVLSAKPVFFKFFLKEFIGKLSTKNIDILWEALKVCLDSHEPGWVTDDFISNQMDFKTVPLRGYEFASVLIYTAQAFMACPESSEKVLNEASFLFMSADGGPLNDNAAVYHLSMRKPIDFQHYSYHPTLKALPAAVKSMNSGLFKEQLRVRGIDPEVINHLLPSWRNDFESLLEAAKSLSAESLDA